MYIVGAAFVVQLGTTSKRASSYSIALLASTSCEENIHILGMRTWYRYCTVAREFVRKNTDGRDRSRLAGALHASQAVPNGNILGDDILPFPAI
jgi:hypothetical protein